MQTFVTTANLEFNGFLSPIEIQADYSVYRGACAIREKGGLAVVPKETTSIRLFAVRANICGVVVGIFDLITPEQKDVLEDAILATEVL